MHTDAKSLREAGDRLFSDKRPLDSRNQEIADHFYVERADFTVSRDIGEEYGSHLMTGYPAMVRRDLGNSLGTMLRPKGREWFEVRAGREDRESHDAKLWLERASKIMRRAMYDPISGFVRATKEGDHDFAAFGGCAISVEMNRRDNALLYRCWHLRDMAWAEDSYGQISQIHRNWKPTVRELCGYKTLGVHPKVEERKDKEPNGKVNCRHVVIRADDYGWTKTRHKWVSLFIDCDNNHVMQESGSNHRIYVLPRWATVSGCAYPYSPAAVIALPDGRLLQAMTLTLIDAAERAANPPMVGVAEAIRGDLNVYPGGFTSVDAEYDERLGDVLRPITNDSRGLPFAQNMQDRVGEQLREAFFLNSFELPQTGPSMTATEVSFRVQEYIRQALPIFEPMEQEYNSALCDMSFDVLLNNGGFGPLNEIPEDLRGMDIEFRFESPLSEMSGKEKGAKFLEAKAMLAQAAEVDPTAIRMMDFGETLRDVLQGIRVPTKWLKSPADVQAEVAREQAAQQAAQVLGTMQQGAEVAETLGRAQQSFMQGDGG